MSPPTKGNLATEMTSYNACRGVTTFVAVNLTSISETTNPACQRCNNIIPAAKVA